MYEFKRLSEVFESAEEIPFDDFSKIIIMSDCHRETEAGRIISVKTRTFTMLH